MIYDFLPDEITLLDSFYINVAQKDVDFLNTFNPDKLLFNFRLTAKVPNIADAPYSGWENTRIGGHTLGHYLAAAAQALDRGYGNCIGKDGKTLFDRLNYIINGLNECQEKLGTGFVFGATMADSSKPELQFDKVESTDASDTWVPWYTFHKLMSGLVNVCRLNSNYKSLSDTAKKIAFELGEWAYNRTKKWTSEIQNRVLKIEYGGMNDCMFELWEIAKNEGYKNAEHFDFVSRSFDEINLFKNVDLIINRHANTTIPKFVGAANRPEYLDYCKNFWDTVVNHHSYITGGNSECEHFGLPDVLDTERSNCNCETCNTYNMLKLTRKLFMATGEKKYADYYENTFINAILASVNADSGMTTYFQPMANGCFKIFCNPDVNKNYFWCCTGTGLENFTKLGDSFFFHNDNTLFINQYVSSKVEWKARGFSTEMLIENWTGGTDLPVQKIHISFHKLSSSSSQIQPTKIALRIPDWAEFNKIDINADTQIENGYFILEKKWTDGDKIELSLPMKIQTHQLTDWNGPGKTFGFKIGPYVLAAELGNADYKFGQVGVQCDVCANKIIRGLEMPLTGNYGGTSNLKILETEIIQLNNPDYNFTFEHIPDTFSFLLKNTNWPGEFKFSPYYLINNQRYGIYWRFTTNNQDTQKEKTLAWQPDDKEISLDGIGIGYGTQTEGNESTYPFMQEKNSVPDPHELTRFAQKGGYFSYVFKVAPGKKNLLVCTFLKADNNKPFTIKSGDCEIASEILNYNGNEEKYSRSFEIPEKLCDKPQLRITFSGNAEQDSAHLCSPTKTVYLKD